jgi:hypothetical protein
MNLLRIGPFGELRKSEYKMNSDFSETVCEEYGLRIVGQLIVDLLILWFCVKDIGS